MPCRTAAVVCLLLAGCASTHPIDPQVASASTDFSRAEEIDVKLSNFKFVPSDLHLVAGHAYNLVIANTASGGHDFAAPEFFAAARIAPGDADLVRGGEIELQAGQSASVHLVPAAGHYDVVCTHLGHAALGMKGSIEVS